MTRRAGGRNLPASSCLAIFAVPLVFLAIATQALSWDSRTHQLIVRLAIGGLPVGALKTSFTQDVAELEEYAIEPDTVLRPRYGLAEGRRHYIDLENFG